MKSTFTIRRFIQGALLGVALASPVMAQMGPGMGAGPGMQGMHGMGRGGMMANQNLVRGGQLMTPEERSAQQVKMRAVKSYDECKGVQTAHRTVLETRARGKGLTLMPQRGNPCEMLKARGLIL